MSEASNSDERSLGQLFASAMAEVSALVHDEIALAKAEIRQDARRAAFGSTAVVGALTLALFAVPMGSAAAALGIHALGITLGWSFLIVFGAYVVLASLLALVAVQRFKKIKKPEMSINSAKESAAVLQHVKPHPRPVGPEDERPAVTAVPRQTD